MKSAIKVLFVILTAVGGFFLLSSFVWESIPVHARRPIPTHARTAAPVHIRIAAPIPASAPVWKTKFPYRQAGLTEPQAAAHLLSRLTYGATPGEVDAVVHMGLEKWFRQQLEANVPDDSLQQVLGRYDALTLSNEQVVATFPKPGQMVRMAIRDGYIDKDSVKTDRAAYRQTIRQYMEQKGYKPEQELFRQFICQKILRAAYSNNQLQEVMTDFWFNHFNVSITKNDCSQFIPAYERDIIRPNALGHFDNLLLKTAKSPAMLYYLDNFSSSGPMPAGAGGNRRFAAAVTTGVGSTMTTGSGSTMTTGSGSTMTTGMDSAMTVRVQNARRMQGLNENYAREVMELHTLGVDGGYTQQDVTQAARVLTGWTVYPMAPEGKNALSRIGEDRMAKRGFVHEGDFLFNANRHDDGEKVVLGKHFGPQGGYQEGVDLLEMLAHHPSTAKFICRKIAIRFVSDDPPAALVDRMAKTFLDKEGDIRQVLTTMVSSPEFWNASAVREKTKSPFELAIGAVRALHGTINQPFQLYNWVSKMGERKYYYQAPTGFPDKGAYWINTGSLLNRMNFGLALASGRIPGVSIDLTALNDHHEPESAQAALVTYCRLIMPERNLDATIKRLEPMLSDPELARKVDAASAKAPAPGNAREAGAQEMGASGGNGGQEMTGAGGNARQEMKDRRTAMAADNGNGGMLAQVVGIIIGSPEYQRR